MAAKISLFIGFITMMLCYLIYELQALWLFLDLVGMIIAAIGLKKGDRNCKGGFILCGISAIFSLVFVILVFIASR